MMSAMEDLIWQISNTLFSMAEVISQPLGDIYEGKLKMKVGSHDYSNVIAIKPNAENLESESGVASGIIDYAVKVGIFKGLLEEQTQTLVAAGPNSTGKSIFLKTAIPGFFVVGNPPAVTPSDIIQDVAIGYSSNEGILKPEFSKKTLIDKSSVYATFSFVIDLLSFIIQSNIYGLNDSVPKEHLENMFTQLKFFQRKDVKLPLTRAIIDNFLTTVTEEMSNKQYLPLATTVMPIYNQYKNKIKEKDLLIIPPDNKEEYYRKYNEAYNVGLHFILQFAEKLGLANDENPLPITLFSERDFYTTRKIKESEFREAVVKAYEELIKRIETRKEGDSIYKEIYELLYISDDERMEYQNSIHELILHRIAIAITTLTIEEIYFKFRKLAHAFKPTTEREMLETIKKIYKNTIKKIRKNKNSYDTFYPETTLTLFIKDISHQAALTLAVREIGSAVIMDETNILTPKMQKIVRTGADEIPLIATGNTDNIQGDDISPFDASFLNIIGFAKSITTNPINVFRMYLSIMRDKLLSYDTSFAKYNHFFSSEDFVFTTIDALNVTISNLYAKYASMWGTSPSIQEMVTHISSRVMAKYANIEKEGSSIKRKVWREIHNAIKVATIAKIIENKLLSDDVNEIDDFINEVLDNLAEDKEQKEILRVLITPIVNQASLWNNIAHGVLNVALYGNEEEVENILNEIEETINKTSQIIDIMTYTEEYLRKDTELGFNALLDRLYTEYNNTVSFIIALLAEGNGQQKDILKKIVEKSTVIENDQIKQELLNYIASFNQKEVADVYKSFRYFIHLPKDWGEVSIRDLKHYIYINTIALALFSDEEQKIAPSAKRVIEEFTGATIKGLNIRDIESLLFSMKVTDKSSNSSLFVFISVIENYLNNRSSIEALIQSNPKVRSVLAEIINDKIRSNPKYRKYHPRELTPDDINTLVSMIFDVISQSEKEKDKYNSPSKVGFSLKKITRSSKNNTKLTNIAKAINSFIFDVNDDTVIVDNNIANITLTLVGGIIKILSFATNPSLFYAAMTGYAINRGMLKNHERYSNPTIKPFFARARTLFEATVLKIFSTLYKVELVTPDGKETTLYDYILDRVVDEEEDITLRDLYEQIHNVDVDSSQISKILADAVSNLQFSPYITSTMMFFNPSISIGGNVRSILLPIITNNPYIFKDQKEMDNFYTAIESNRWVSLPGPVRTYYSLIRINDPFSTITHTLSSLWKVFFLFKGNGNVAYVGSKDLVVADKMHNTSVINVPLVDYHTIIDQAEHMREIIKNNKGAKMVNLFRQ